MIFLTIGTQLPFDRLVMAVDEWAATAGVKVVAQIGPGKYIPRHIEHHTFIAPEDFDKLLRETECIISHAGMGTIISAMTYGKPAILMAREAARGEHRNDHQLATVKKFRSHPSIKVVESGADIGPAYLALTSAQAADGQARLSPHADSKFIAAIRGLIIPEQPA